MLRCAINHYNYICTLLFVLYNGRRCRSSETPTLFHRSVDQRTWQTTDMKTVWRIFSYHIALCYNVNHYRLSSNIQMAVV